MAKRTIDGVTADFQEGGWYQGRQYWGGQLGAPGVIINPNQVGAGQVVSAEVQRQSNPTGPLMGFSDLGQVQQHLNGLQNGIYQNGGDVPQVQSTQEIFMDLKNSGLLPVGEAPRAPSLVDQYTQLSQQRGLDRIQADITNLTAQQDEIAAQLRINSNAERGKPVAQNVIEGRISEQQRSAQEQYDFVGRQLARKTNELQAANASIQMIMQFTQTDFQNASQSYAQQFERAVTMLNLVRGIQNDQKDERQKAIDNARANLQVMREAIGSGQLRYDQLPTDQKMMVSRLEMQAYGVTGIVSALRPQEREMDTYTDARGNRVAVFYDPASRTTRNVILGNTGSGAGTPITFGGSTSGWTISGAAPKPTNTKPNSNIAPSISSLWGR